MKLEHYQLKIAKLDVPKIAFQAQYGHYECLMTPYGLVKALKAFMAQ